MTQEWGITGLSTALPRWVCGLGLPPAPRTVCRLA